MKKKNDKKAALQESVANDIIVRIPPVKEYSIKVKVKGIEKAIPRIVEPEEI